MKVLAFTLVIIIAIALVAWVGFPLYLMGEDKGYNQGYPVGYDDGYTLGWVMGWETGNDAGWAAGYAEPRPLRLFGSVEELHGWLVQDDTDSLKYIPITFDCDDFAMVLAQNAAADGYFIGFYYDRPNWHAKNLALIEGKPKAIFLIEPQTDYVEPIWMD